MLWNSLLSVSTTAALLASVRAAPQVQGTQQSPPPLSSPTCCADCCDANGNFISPGMSTPTSGAPGSTGPFINPTSLSGYSGQVTGTVSSKNPASSGTVSTGNSNNTESGNSTSNGNSTGIALSNPYFFLYSDNWVTGCLPDPSEVEGWNVM